MPDSRGVSRTQSGPGSGNGSFGSSFNGPTAAPRPGDSVPASRAAANFIGLRSKTNLMRTCVRARAR